MGKRSRRLRKYLKMRILKIYHDDYPDDPRSWDHLGTMVCWHHRYNLGDPHDFRTPDEFQEWVKEVGRNNIIMLPLYLYDHSGITMGTTPFNDPWDSSQVGWIYATKNRLREEFKVKRVTREIIRKAEDILREEVEIYDHYLRGEVYGFIAYEADGQIEIDSGGGFYGDNPVQNGMIDCVPGEFRDKLNSVELRDGIIIVS